MALFIKAKRVSGPLNDHAKARLLSSTDTSSSSGSEHQPVDLCCLCGLVHAFLESDETHQPALNSDDDDELNRGDGGFYAHAEEKVRDLLEHRPTLFLLDLRSTVTEAESEIQQLVCKRGVIMAQLRERGYDAGLCKAKWESSGGSAGITAGSYEYIDVEGEDRYIVDLDFAAQFELARSTSEYKKLVAMLPRVMVARAEEVKQVIRIMAEASKRSLKSQELSMPPWRKRRYMMAKWFGPYRRCVSPLPLLTPSTVCCGGGQDRVADRRVWGWAD